MTDVKLTIGAKDEGAAAILKLVADALAKLRDEQAKGLNVAVQTRTEAQKLAETQRRSEAAVRAHTRSVRESIEAARQANQALRDAASAMRTQTQAQLQATSQLAKAQQQATQAAISNAQQQSKALSDQTRSIQQQTQAMAAASGQQARAQQQATQQQIAASRQQSAQLAQQTRAMQQATQQQIIASAAQSRALQQQTQAAVTASAQQTKALLKDTQAQITIGQQRNQQLAAQTRAMQQQTQAQVSAARQATQAMQQQTQASLASTRAQVRGSQQVAQAALQQANAIRQASAQAISASRAQASAQQAAARTAAASATAASRIQVAQIRAQQQAIHDQTQLRIAQLQQVQTSNTQVDALSRLGKAFAKLYSAVKVAQGILGFIKAGLEFSEVLQQATLGVATLITAQARLQDAQGRTLTGMQALNEGMKLATDQITQLRIAGIRTAATTEQLVTAFQQAVGPGLRAGLNLDQIRKITVGITQAAAAIALPMHQLNEEVRSLLAGTITYNTRIAKTLGITNAMVASWKEQGIFAQKLVERFNAFNTASERALENMSVLKSGLVEAFQVFAGAATKPLFESLRQAGFEALKGMFDFDKGTISAAFAGIVDIARDIFGNIGQLIAAAIRAAIDAVRQLSVYFEQNRASIQGVVESSKEFVIQLSRIVGQVAKFVFALVDAGIRTGFIEAVLKTVASLSKIIADNTILIRDTLAAITIFKGIGAITALAAGLTPLGAGLLLVAAALTAFVVGLNTANDSAEKLARQQKIADEQDRQRSVALHNLTVQYDILQRKITSGKLRTEELSLAKEELRKIVTQITQYAPQYSHALNQWGVDAQETAEQIRKLQQEQMKLLQSQFEVARARQLSVAQQIRDEKAVTDTLEASIKLQREEGHEGEARKSEKLLEASKERMTELTTRSREAKAAVGEALNAVAVLIDEEKKLREPVKVTPTATDAGEDKGKANNDFRQAIEAQIRLIKSQLKLTKEALDSDLKEREISFKDYVDGITAAERQALNAELALRRKQLAGTKDEGEKAQIRERIQEIINERLTLTHEGNVKLRELEQQLTNEMDAINAQRLRQEQNAGEARRIELERQYRELRRTIEANNGDTTFIDRFINVEAARARLEQVQRLLGRAMSQTQQSIDQVNELASRGLISTMDQANLVGAAFEAEIAAIQKALPELRALAEASNQQEAIDGVRQLEVELARLQEQQRLATSEMARLIEVGLGGLQSGMAEAFSQIGTTIEETHKHFDESLGKMVEETTERLYGLRDVARDVGIAILRSLQQQLAQEFAQNVTNIVRGALGKIGINIGGDSSAAVIQQNAATVQATAATTNQAAATTFATSMTLLQGLVPQLATIAAGGGMGNILTDTVGNTTVKTAAAAAQTSEIAAATALQTAGTTLLTAGAALGGSMVPSAAALGGAAAALGGAAAALTAAAGAGGANSTVSQIGDWLNAGANFDGNEIQSTRGGGFGGPRMSRVVTTTDRATVVPSFSSPTIVSPRTASFSRSASDATLAAVSARQAAVGPTGSVQASRVEVVLRPTEQHVLRVMKSDPGVNVQVDNMRRRRRSVQGAIS